jgi:hypothetical protein
MFGLIPPFSLVDSRLVAGTLLIIVVGVLATGLRTVEDVIRSKTGGQHINSDAAFWFSVLIGALGGSVVFLFMWIVGEWWKGL